MLERYNSYPQDDPRPRSHRTYRRRRSPRHAARAPAPGHRPVSSECGNDEAAALLRSDFGFVKVGEWESYEMFSDPAVKRVAKFEKADEKRSGLPDRIEPGMEVERSFAFEMKRNLARFDFGICMAGWDGNEVYTADEYKRDVEQKTFTLNRADDQAQFNYSMSRFEKMTADRYAGWQLVVREVRAEAAEYA